MRRLVKMTVGLSLLSGVVWADNHALVIGCCEKYPYLTNIRQLYGTKNDAEHIYNLLVNKHHAVSEKNALLITGKDATYRNITTKLKSMERKKDLKAGDTLYMFYSGHGTSLFDKGYFGKKFKTDKMVREWISNSTGLIPYDLNPKNLSQTMIITKRDFKPVFQRLDERGIRIVWITDACFAGHAYRGANDGSPQKFVTFDSSKIVYNKKSKDPNYKHLLFYGASLATLPTSEHPYQGESRGDFSVEVEKCLNKSYKSSYIRHRDFKKCLQSNFANTQIQHNYYPKNRSLDNQIVIKASTKPKRTQQPQSYRDRLFALQNNQPLLEMNVSSLRSTNQVIKTFCRGERLSVNLSGKRGRYIIALSQDKNGKVIMLQPDKKNKMRGNELFQTDVKKPFGRDRLKVFATDDKSIYNRALQFWDKPQGVLSSTDMEKLYKALKSSGNFKTASMTIETIKTDIETCKQGD